jgi:hypothetical protein
MKKEQRTTTVAKAELYDVVKPLLTAMYNEFKELSKKKPDGAVSKDKIKVVNRLLLKCRDILKDESSIEYLDLLVEDNVPQNSDVVLMLSQYEATMRQFYSIYNGRDGISRKWFISKK